MEYVKSLESIIKFLLLVILLMNAFYVFSEYNLENKIKEIDKLRELDNKIIIDLQDRLKKHNLDYSIR